MKLDISDFPKWLHTPRHNVAVLLPSRGRPEALKKSIFSLFDNAANPTRVQLLLGFDSDDQASIDFGRGELFDELKTREIDSSIITFDRMGYLRLNEYVNVLGRYADARWLMFWNDDAIMQSQGWDDKIIEHDGEFACLRMPTHNEHPYAIFPIVPVEWFRLMNYLSPHQISDAWLSQTAYLLGIMKNIDVSVLHDRHDLTGNNNDETYKERVMLEGRPDDPRDFNHINWRTRRVMDAMKIAWYLKQTNRDTSWFEKVMKGQQDPWTTMMSPEQDPNHQLKKFG